ncbi:MAG: GNAT family N-acetyltransferase [Candidatus Dormibacteraeota bacterium]|nr:GNAT family N-acetyltransferase [Candidatus Dormibacteraeota bacterium]MBV9525048.1 GNAT family N-acetyltransferase [Candidatus Dormibacteraeota bacterium]
MAWNLTTGRGLSGDALDRVLELQAECEAADSLDLKLEPAHERSDGHPDTVLAWVDGRIDGYCGVDFGIDAEVCGMVHPRMRGAGCGSALLREACEMVAAAGRESVLVICEDAAPHALAWLRRLGASEDHAELRMRMRIGAGRHSDTGLLLREATAADTERVIDILADGFGEPRSAIGAPPLHETFVALEGEEIVGTTRLVRGSRRWMIYGFVVDRRVRGRRVGARMLSAALDLLARHGVRDVGLEVDTENAAARRLYSRAGFKPVTTYRYMRLATVDRM